MTTATTEPHTPTDVQRSALAVTPGSAFRVKTGTVQLFIVCHTPFIHVAASLPSYHRSEPIGCEWERRCAQWVCDQFNALEDKSNVTEHDVRNMLHESKRRVPYSPNEYNAFNYTGGNYYDSKKDVRPVTTIEKLQEFIKENEVIFKENEVICKNNENAKKIAFSFMDKLGVPRKKYGFETNRSKNRKWFECHWIKELESLFPVSCAFTYNENKRWAENEIKAIQKYEQYQIVLKEKIEKEKQQELKNQEKTALIVKLISKYDLKFNEPIPPVNDVILELAKKNKYLYLAYCMSKNRGDWNDGYSYAETGLNYFISQSDEKTKKLDNEIYEDVSSYFEDFNDGRVFRDCEWNYDRLFKLVEINHNDLYKDWSALLDFKEYEY